ncbi:hypothetical protein C4K88_02590 [Arthrobacter pityocampae]|uniref:Uncharacterized protein n=1 Tax=Arthrobacter pityocampae TaxID=547334 RepID=A0A2S5J1S3_9MICC|nr:DUF6541 family protein [Arthrobacter pityocampae]PPB50779.1 hypothetical protein C4K88_02590 [Arthrobacter pityocampae]
MSWWATAPAFASTVLVFFGPGLLVLAAAGVRRLSLAALSAPLSMTIGSCLAVVLPFVGVAFNPVSYLVFTLCLAAAALLARRLLLRNDSAGLAPVRRFGDLALVDNQAMPREGLPRWITRLLVPVAVAFPAVIIGGRYIAGFGAPENFSQTFDNVYHLNAIKHIAETQNGSALSLGNLTEASQAFYPAAMHDLMALVVMMTGTSVPVAVNVGTIVLGALVWPLSCVFLISRVIGYRPIPLLAAGVLCAGMSGFPYMMVAFGVLYPNHAAIALLPAALGLVVEALGMTPGRRRSFSVSAGLLAVAVVPGLALAHPSTLLALLAFAGPVVAARAVREFQGRRGGTGERSRPVLWGILFVLYAGVTLVAWLKVRPSLAFAPWTPFQTNARAIGEVLGSAPMGATTAWVLLILTVAGIYVAARQFRDMWWILMMFVIGGVLYMIVSSWSLGWFRTFMTGVWYNDSFRLAALLPVVTLPLAVLGAEWLTGLLRRIGKPRTAEEPAGGAGTSPVARTRRAVSGITSSPITAAAVVLVLGVGTQGGTLSGVQTRMEEVFALEEESPLLTTDELALLQRVPDLVPADGVIVGNPRTGASLVYALADRRTVAPHIFGDRTDAEQTLLDHWDEAGYNVSVCDDITREGALWALDFGDQEIVPGDEPYIGLRALEDGSAPGISLVAEEGDARLYRVDACTES